MPKRRSTKLEVAQRAHRFADLLAKGASNRQLIQLAAEQWEVGERQARTIIRQARELLVTDMEIERPEFLATRLGTLDVALQKAMKDNNIACVIGIVRLQTELTGLLGSRASYKGF